MKPPPPKPDPNDALRDLFAESLTAVRDIVVGPVLREAYLAGLIEGLRTAKQAMDVLIEAAEQQKAKST